MSAHPFPSTHIGQRIVVVGTTGSGKTALARQLARRIHCPHVEIDALHWGPHWTACPVEEFREKVAQALSGDCWTADGNYRAIRDQVWGRADTVIWLDYPLPVILYRLTRRTLRRIITQEELWNGNRETWGNAVFSRDSLFLWALKTYRRRRLELPVLFAMPEYARLIVVHLRSPRMTAQWLSKLSE